MRLAPVLLLCFALLHGCGGDDGPSGTDAGSGGGVDAAAAVDGGGTVSDAGPTTRRDAGGGGGGEDAGWVGEECPDARDARCGESCDVASTMCLCTCGGGFDFTACSCTGGTWDCRACGG